MKTYSEIIKSDFNCYVTPASNLEVGDVINWIGIYDAGKEVYFDTISLLKGERLIPFKVVDIDYNPNKPDDIIFEFDKVLFPVNSKFITINKDRFAKTDIHNAKVNGVSLFDIQRKQHLFNCLVDSGKINIEEDNKDWYEKFYNEKGNS
jgi:hypothetical protein